MANRHGMEGLLSDGFPQGRAEAAKGVKDSIQASINEGKIGDAIHTAQDSVTPGHKNMSMKDWGWNFQTFVHKHFDVNPRLGDIIEAIDATKSVLTDANYKSESKNKAEPKTTIPDFGDISDPSPPGPTSPPSQTSPPSDPGDPGDPGVGDCW